MRNIALKLMYNGTAYHGWQIQKNLPTVAETLEKGLSTICCEPIRVVGCGRTDAGVHAERYIANFCTGSTIPCDRLPLAVNTRLPEDIVVRKAFDVAEDFNAIGSCLKKEYTYRIFNSRIRNPFYVNRAYFYPKRLDEEVMDRAARAFEGTHDFRSVRSVGTETKTTVRTIYYCYVTRSGDLLELKVCANGFLYNMVRAITGTVLYAAEGKLTPEDIPRILDAGNRTLAGPTVPPGGLYLTKLWYEDERSMADYRQEQPDTQEPRRPLQEQEGKKSPGRGGVFLRRLGTLLVTALVVLGIVSVAMMDNGNILDRLRRWLNYGAAAAEEQYLFAADARNQYAQVGDYLVVLTQNYLQFLEDSGSAYQSVEELGLSHPVLDTGGGLAVAYDAGGQQLVAASPEGAVLELPLPEGYGYISARLNDSGWLAAVSQKSGYKGAVTVYNSEQELVYEVDLSSQFVVDALVSGDCKSVLVVTYGEENGAFCTELIRYRLDADRPETAAVLSDHVGFVLEQAGERWVSLSDKAVAFTDMEGAQDSYSFGGQYLQDYAFSGEFTALFLTRYQSGSIGTLVTLDSQGNVLGTMPVSDEILDIDAAGAYLAVLQSNTLSLYGPDLTELSRLEDTDYAGRVLMSEDGSALVIGGSSARRYLP